MANKLNVSGYYDVVVDGLSERQDGDSLSFQILVSGQWINVPAGFVESYVTATGGFTWFSADIGVDISWPTDVKAFVTSVELGTTIPAMFYPNGFDDPGTLTVQAPNPPNAFSASSLYGQYIKTDKISVCPDPAADNYHCCNAEATDSYACTGGGASNCINGTDCCYETLPSEGIIEDLTECTYIPKYYGEYSEYSTLSDTDPAFINSTIDFPLSDYIVISGVKETDYIIINATFLPFNQPVDVVGDLNSYLNDSNYPDFANSAWTVSYDSGGQPGDELYVILETNPDNCFSSFDETGTAYQQAYTGSGNSYICLKTSELPEGINSVIKLTNTITNDDGDEVSTYFNITLADANYYGCTDPIADNYFCDIDDTNAALCEDGGDTLIVDPAGGNISCIYYGCSSSYYSTYYSNTRYANNYNCQTSQFEGTDDIPTQPCCAERGHDKICAGNISNSGECNGGGATHTCDGGTCISCGDDVSADYEPVMITNNDQACVFYGCIGTGSEDANGDDYGTYALGDTGKSQYTGCYGDTTAAVCDGNVVNSAVLKSTFDSGDVYDCCFAPAGTLSNYCDFHGCTDAGACNTGCFPGTDQFTTTEGRTQITDDCGNFINVTEDPSSNVTYCLYTNSATYYDDSDNDGLGVPPGNLDFPTNSAWCNDEQANTNGYVTIQGEGDPYCDDNIVTDSGYPRDCHGVCGGHNVIDECGACVCDGSRCGHSQNDTGVIGETGQDGLPVATNTKNLGDSMGTCGCINTIAGGFSNTWNNVANNQLSYTCWDGSLICQEASDFCTGDPTDATHCNCPDLSACNDTSALNHYDVLRNLFSEISVVNRTSITNDGTCFYFKAANTIDYHFFEHASDVKKSVTYGIIVSANGGDLDLSGDYTYTLGGAIGENTHNYLDFFRQTSGLDKKFFIDFPSDGSFSLTDSIGTADLMGTHGTLTYIYDVESDSGYGPVDGTALDFIYKYDETSSLDNTTVTDTLKLYFLLTNYQNYSYSAMYGPSTEESDPYVINFKTHSQLNGFFGWNGSTITETEGITSNTYNLNTIGGITNPEGFANVRTYIYTTDVGDFVSTFDLIPSTKILTLTFHDPPTATHSLDTITIRTEGDSSLDCSGTVTSNCDDYLTNTAVAAGVTSICMNNDYCRFISFNDFKISADDIVPQCNNGGIITTVEVDDSLTEDNWVTSAPVIDLENYVQTEPYIDLINTSAGGSYIITEPTNGDLYEWDGSTAIKVSGYPHTLTQDIHQLKYVPYVDYPPISGGAGSDSFDFNVTDIYGTAASDQPCAIDILVNAVQDLPSFITIDASITITEDSTYANNGDYTVGATDPDGEHLIFSCINSTNVSCDMTDTNLGGGSTLDEQFGTFQLQTTTFNYFSATPENITIRVNDGFDNFDKTIPVTITNVNDPPVANSTSKTVNEDTLESANEITLTGNPGPGAYESEALTYIITDLPAGRNTTRTVGEIYYRTDATTFVKITAGVLPFTLPAGNYSDKVYYKPKSELAAGTQENDIFKFKVYDGEYSSLSVNVTVTITGVDDLPSFTGIPDPITFNEEAIFPPFLVTDNDPDASMWPDEITIVVEETWSTGIPRNASNQKLNITVENSIGSANQARVTLQGKQDKYGTTHIKVYQAETGDSTNIIRLVTINNVADAPTATSGTASVDEASSVNIILTGNDVDPITILTFAIDETIWPQHGSVALSGNTATYTPNVELDNGVTITDYIHFYVTDETGLTSASPGIITITITGMNDTPDLQGVPDTGFFEEDSYFDITIYANDPDPNASLDFTCEHDVNSDTSDGISCACVGSCTGIASDADVTFRFTANTVTHPVTGLLDEFNGLEHFIITVSDGAATDDAEILVVSTPLNDVPVLTAISAVNVDEDSSITFQVDATDPDNTGLTFDCTVAGGSTTYLSCDANNDVGTDKQAEITITAIDQDYFGNAHSVNISVTDGTTPDDQDVTINIISVNDLPVAQPITHSVAEESSVADAGNLITLLSQQPTNESGETIRYYIQTVPAAGTLHLPTDPYTEITANTLLDSGVDKVRYVPPVDVEGPVSDYTSFEYKAWDGTTDAST